MQDNSHKSRWTIFAFGLLLILGCNSGNALNGLPVPSALSPSPTPKPTASPNPSPGASASPTAFPNPFPSPSPSASATATPIFSPFPSPSPSPSPTPFTKVEKFWFSPEPGSDHAEMFERPDEWSTARSKMDIMYIASHSLYPTCGPICKNNTWARMVEVQAFQKLKQWDIPLYLAVGSVKPEIHCDAKIYARDAVDLYIKGIKDNGGLVKGLTMDWPLSAGSETCGQTMEETANHVVNYVKTVTDGYALHHPGQKIDIGTWEGTPTFTADQLITWMNLLISKGYKPHHFIADFDHERFRREGKLPLMRSYLLKLQNYCRANGILYGVAIWGNDLRSPTTYYAQARKYAQEVKRATGGPDFIQVISWEYWVQKQNAGDVFPYNLPETDPLSHTHFFSEMLQYFKVPTL